MFNRELHRRLEGDEERDVAARRKGGLSALGPSAGTIRVREAGSERGRSGTLGVDLEVDGQRVSGCIIVPLRLRIGCSVLRMDGIGDVETLEAYRYRGFARRVLDSALQLMQQGDAALSMLYGITDFYPKFGFTTVGAELDILLPPLRGEDVKSGGRVVRPFRRDDLPALQSLYDRATADVVGAAVRPRDGYPWTALLETVEASGSEDCRVIEEDGGRISGYVWRGQNLTFVRAHSRYNPDDLVIAEAMADGPESANLALDVCRRWAAEEERGRGRDISQVRIFTAHTGPVAAAARHVSSTFHLGFGADGGWMARVLSTRRLFSALQPELSRRLAAANVSFSGPLRLITDAGDVSLTTSSSGITIDEQPLVPDITPKNELVCRLPQTTLAQLVMGSHPPDDLLARLLEPPQPGVTEILRAIFPSLPSHIFLADRF